jgi:hypothetical protein
MKVSIALEEGHMGGEMGEGQRKNYDNMLKGDGWRKRRGCCVKRMRGDLDKALDLMGAEEIKKGQVTLISICLVSFSLISGRGANRGGATGRGWEDECGGRQERAGITCRRCWQDGHMQNECRNPPLCYYCHDVGHMSAHCPEVEAQRQGLNMYGFGMPEMGFYHIHVPYEKQNMELEEFSGVLMIKEGVANKALVQLELKNYDETWDWKVT